MLYRESFFIAQFEKIFEITHIACSAVVAEEYGGSVSLQTVVTISTGSQQESIYAAFFFNGQYQQSAPQVKMPVENFCL